MSVRAVGDCAVIERLDELVLANARGPIKAFELERVDATGQLSYGDVVTHAVLADPPRLAVLQRGLGVRNGGLIEERSVALLDPTTGEIERAIDVDGADLLGFDPTGARLLVRTRSGLAIVDDDVAPHAITGTLGVDAPLLTVHFARDGKSCIVSEGLADNGRIARVDCVNARPVWAARIDHRAVVVDADVTRAVVLEGGAPALARAPLVHVDGVGVWDLVHGRRVATVLEDDGGAPLRSLFANRDLTRIAALDTDGVLRVFDATKRDAHWLLHGAPHRVSLDCFVDVERDRVLCAHDGGALLATLDGAVLVRERAARFCFAGTGAAVIVVDGAVHVLDADAGRARILEGPTGIVDIAPHPRGAIAIDDDDCAHVIEVPA